MSLFNFVVKMYAAESSKKEARNCWRVSWNQSRWE